MPIKSAKRKEPVITDISEDMRVGIVDVVMVGAKTKVKWVYTMYSGTDRIHTSEAKYDSKGAGSFMVGRKRYWFKDFVKVR